MGATMRSKKNVNGLPFMVKKKYPKQSQKT